MRPTAVLLAMTCAVACVEAQKIPIRQIGPAEAVAMATVDVQSLVRPLSDGRVIVTYHRSVGILSADLKTYTSIVDSLTIPRPTLGSPNQLAIITGRGDTTYVADDVARGLITIDPTGVAGRMIAIPSSRDMGTVAFTTGGTFRTYLDPKGRLLYRSSTPIGGAMGGILSPATAPPVTQVPADSFPLVRADFETRVVDTVAMIRIPSSMRTIMEQTNDGLKTRRIQYVGPVIDAWTMLTDGTIAIVRGSDYHVDWIHPDGSRTSTPKMQLDWRRITDEEKTAIVDSLKKRADA